MSRKTLNGLKYICKLMYESFEIPTFLLDSCGNLIFQPSTDFKVNPLFASKHSFLRKFSNNPIFNYPILKITDYGEVYFSVYIQIDNLYEGLIIVGPSLNFQPSDENISGLISDFNIKTNKREEFSSYYKSIPVISNMKSIYASMHLYYMIYQIPLKSDEVLKSNRVDSLNISRSNNLNTDISKKRQNISLHHDELYEKEMLRFLQEGKTKQVINSWRSLPEKGEIGTLSKMGFLRDKKNLGIAIVTLATRAAIKGGVYFEVAYTLSDYYIQVIDSLKNLNEVNNIIEEALVNFTKMVQKKSKKNYSSPINKCLNYIFNHLYEHISLSILAEVIGMHPSYLSALFKKEVGITIQTYIHKAKIKEAQTLIEFTDHSITKIASLLNFYDQSYFTKIFKRYTNKTPLYFRQASCIIKLAI